MSGTSFMSNTIETFDLTKQFNGLVAVDKLNITVEKGEVFGLLGPNGAGKTTTISMLCTILNPTSGTAKVNGYDIVKQANMVRKSIGIVFQDPSIDDRLTGRENLYMHADLYGVPPSEQKARVDEVLKLVELEARADDILRTYSSGMRRRLEIARGLIHSPKVLFLDEPTIGLDPQTREHIWTYILEMKRARDVTIILTTHYMEEADKLSDRVGIIDYGKIVALDTPVELKEALEGDVITIKTQDVQKLSETLAKDMNLQNARIMDETLELTAPKGEALLPKIVDTASRNNIIVDAVSVREPSLEDVFLHYTGREIRAEGSSELHGVAAIRRRAIK
jgi:ABC-2 type transport system ATP-binding protein